MFQKAIYKYSHFLSQDHDMLQQTINNLDEVSKKIFLMDYSGYTSQDIALQLHLSELVIQSKLQLIKKQLKNELAGMNKV